MTASWVELDRNPRMITITNDGGITHTLVVHVDSALDVTGNVTATLATADIEIGAVELKDATTSNRASINAGGQLAVDGGFTATDHSGNITAGNTSQTIITTPANGFAIYNPDPSEFIWISDTGAAVPNGQGSIPVWPLGGYETPVGARPLGNVSAIAATTGHKFTTRSW